MPENAYQYTGLNFYRLNYNENNGSKMLIYLFKFSNHLCLPYMVLQLLS